TIERTNGFRDVDRIWGALLAFEVAGAQAPFSVDGARVRRPSAARRGPPYGGSPREHIPPPVSRCLPHPSPAPAAAPCRRRRPNGCTARAPTGARARRGSPATR